MRKALLQLTTLLLLFSANCSIAAESDVIVLTSGLESVNPAPSVDFLLDPEDTLKIGDILLRQFNPLDSERIDFGFTTDKIWLQFRIQNSSEELLHPLIRTSARFMRPMQIFLVHQNGSIEELLFNDETSAFEDRPLPELRFLAAELALEPHELATVYIKFGAGGIAALSLQISSSEEALKEQAQASIVLAVFATLLLTLALVNFFHYRATRKRPYLLYVFFESFNVLYVAHVEGFTFQYLWPNLPQWNDDASPFIAGVGLIIGNLFAAEFLEAKKYSPRLHKYFLVIIALSFFSLVITAITGNTLGVQITALMLPLSLLLSVTTAVVVVKRGHYAAQYFVVAWSLFLVSAAVWSGGLLDFLDLSENNFTLYKATVAIQAIIMSMGLADQVRRKSNEHSQTQAELVHSLEVRLKEAKEHIKLEKKQEEMVLKLLEKSALLANTSHDINQPLQSIKAAVKGFSSKESNREVTAQLKDTLDYMESVLKMALDDASNDLRESSEDTQFQALLIDTLFQQIVSVFKDRALSKSIALNAFRTKAIAVIPELPLKRCLLNLTANAVDNTSGGKIFIGIRQKNNHLVFQVYDTGCGISVQEMHNLKTPLIKGQKSSGHGLGLAIVNEICSEYGWKFDIQSTLNKGSCFSISIPRGNSRA